jgi:hypothetical protein
MDSYNVECFKLFFVKTSQSVRSNFLETPPTHHALVTKMTHKGVTVLKDSRFGSRVSGSRTHIVRPDGFLIDNETRMALESPKEKPGRTKKISNGGPPETKKREIQYFVNEKLISARTFSYVMAMDKPVLHAFTISFPLCVSDDQGYQYLNTWLTRCGEEIHLRDYLWVAERQPDTGTIHFHLLVPQYLNVVKANRIMQVILCTQIKKRKLNWHRSAAKRYNGVDIAKNRNTKRVTNFAKPGARKALVSYIVKYFSKGKKNQAKEGFSHYAWHNSRGFSSMMTAITLTELEGKFLGVRNLINMDKTFCSEFFTWIPWKNLPPGFFTDALRTVNRAILNKGSTRTMEKINFILPGQLN